MAGHLLSKLRDILFPGGKDGTEFHSMAPVEVIKLTHQRIFQLAEEIRAHADRAPYPHIADALRGIASEKKAAAKELQQFLRNLGVWVAEPTTLSVSGKNHWDRMTRDLKEQKSLDDFLQVQEARLAGEEPEIARLLGQIRTHQASHRELLISLVAVADPLANQT